MIKGIKSTGNVFLVLLIMLVGSNFVSANGSTETADESGEKVYTFRIGYENNPDEPVHKISQEWARLVEEKTGGRAKVELFPSAQLGTKKDLTEQMLMGSNVVTITDPSFLMDYVPEIGILAGPFLGSTFEDYHKITSSGWFKAKVAELEKHGLTIVTARWIYGARHVVANKPIRTPQDLAGLKLRCPANELFMKTVESMGATPTPMPLGDVYPAVAQGVVDGMENPIPVIYGSKVHEEAKYVSLTGHITLLTMWIGSADFFNSIPADIALAMREAADEAGDMYNAQLVQNDADYTKKLEADGVTMIEDVDVKAFRAVTASVYEDMWSKELLEEVRSILE